MQPISTCSLITPAMVQEVHLSDNCENLPCYARITLEDGREKIVSLDNTAFQALINEVAFGRIFLVSDDCCHPVATQAHYNCVTEPVSLERVLTSIFNH